MDGMFENDFDTTFSSDRGGGGFVSSQPLERKQNVRGRQSQMAPVAIKSIHEMLPGQEQIRVGPQEFTCVTIVGLVRSVSRSGPAVFYEIDDMSGKPVLVRQYFEMNEDETPMMENTYVRVYGALKTFEDKRSLMAYRILPVTDMNELTAHLLEIVQCKLFYTKDVVKIAQDKATGGPPMPYSTAVDNVRGSSVPSSFNNYGSSSRNTALSGPGSGPNSGPINMVYNYLKQSRTEEGVSVQELRAHFRTIPPEQITVYLDFLTQEGQIYTTVDDDHFKATD